MSVKKILAWGLVAAAIAGAGPLVLGRSQPAYKTSLDEISRMSEAERTALDRRYQQYKGMTEEERSNLRQLHRELEEDRAKDARLLGTMHDYCDWLKLIDAWQQDDLVHIADPLERAKRVAAIHAERQQKVAEGGDGSHNDQRLMFERFTLNEDQLTRMFDVLAKRLTSLSEEEQKEINQAKGMKRWGLQMKQLNKQVPVDRLFQTLGVAELNEMVEASGHQELIKVFTDKNLMPDFPERKKDLIRRDIGLSLFLQKRRESGNITDEQLATFLAKMPREQRDELLTLRAEDFKTQLSMRYLEQDEDIRILHSMLGPLFRNAQQMINRSPGSFGGPGGPDGPGGPAGPGGRFRPEEGQGDRRPFGRGFEGRRPDGRPQRDGRGGFGPPESPPGEGPPPDGPPPEGPPPRSPNPDQRPQ